ncbi:MAG: winged helix-turn-helix domain-containing protein [Spirochaetes bacterium]|nr:winged helix-turn-helix domain-containing protein [Spirochaetota bacterium]
MLSLIVHEPNLTAREIAHQVGITERAVWRILADLEQEHYITKRKVGRRLEYTINLNRPFRHQTHQDKKLIDLINLLKPSVSKREP